VRSRRSHISALSYWDIPNARTEECRRYVQMLRQTIRAEPDGCSHRIARNTHDFGTHLDVVFEFAPENEPARDYALKVEANAPGRWKDATSEQT
jgi:hypothetical protein